MASRRRAVLVAGLASVVCSLAAPQPQRAQAGAAGEVLTRNVTDETGRRVAVPMTVRRIVSLAPNLTEILYDLGVQDRLVGVSNYSDYPPAAKTKPRIGDPIEPSLEHVLAQRPDLVLATTAINRRETVEALEKLGIPVYATDPRTVEGILDSIQHIAGLVGAGAGEELVTRLHARLAELRQRLAGRPVKRVLFVMWAEPLITVGPHTFLADALRWAGAQSVIEVAQDWPHISFEEVVRLNPEYFVLAASHPKNAAEDLRARPGWRDLEAVREGRVAEISDAVNRPSAGLVDAIEQLARELHPDAFEGQYR